MKVRHLAATSLALALVMGVCGISAAQAAPERAPFQAAEDKREGEKKAPLTRAQAKKKLTAHAKKTFGRRVKLTEIRVHGPDHYIATVATLDNMPRGKLVIDRHTGEIERV